jgi:hypothetical protein
LKKGVNPQGFAPFFVRHCERSAAIHADIGIGMDCRAALAITDWGIE